MSMFKTKIVLCDVDKARFSALALCTLICCIGLIGGARAASDQVAGVDPEFAALIARCAPTVHPETMAALVSTESRGHQFAIADAGPVKMPWSQRKHLVRSFYMGSAESATAKALELIAAGHTVSLGLAQVNDRNLARLGLTVRAVFDPCTNLAAGGKIVTEFYLRAVKKFGVGERALRAAISGYNSGDWDRGEKEGYVNMVYKQVGRPLVMKTAPVRVAVAVPAIGRGAVGGSGKVTPAVIEKSDGGRVFAMSSGEFVVAQ